MIPYNRKLVIAAINEELHEEFWQACEERKQFALSNFKELKNGDDAMRARFIELWREACQRIEWYVAAEKKLIIRYQGEKGVRERLMRGAKNCCVGPLNNLCRELELAEARKDGYEEGRKDGIVEVFNRDKKNREIGQGFAETPQGKKKREKAELCDAACEAYYNARQTENPISWEKAVKCAARKLKRRITKLRSKAEMARLWYPDWREKHVRKRDSNPKP